jgi:uncharacterized Zn finger protein
VLTINIHRGRVFAKVQGSRARAYEVEINVAMIEEEEWERLARLLSEQAIFAAKLLAGEMPENIEEVFGAADLSLFPEADADLHTDCSCPDWSNPCKHIAAVYYLLGEEFDRDPFLIFRLRGIDRSEIIEAIGGPAALRGAPVPAPEPPPEPEFDEADFVADRDDEATAAAKEAEAAALLERPPEPLPLDAHAFWAGEHGAADPRPDEEGADLRIPSVPGALARRLGGYAFWRGNDDCAAVIDRVYQNASIGGIDVYLGESSSSD